MKNVFVGLSGGVDSAVSAALLKDQGYNVVGAFIKIWRPEFSECPWREDRLDAMRVAAALQIPFKEVDLSEEYRKSVIDDLIENYSKGITPNPDVLCNRHIKFGAFWQWAKSEGADLVATGHYAQTDGANLCRGEQQKDQSYFLYTLTADDLSHTLFPVGHLPKSDVRELAQKFEIPVATKHDSQGLCFVGDVSMPEFLSRILSVEEGDVLNCEGQVIGQHNGAALYTLGERHGFTVRSGSAHEKPHYITALDTRRNTISVSERREAAHVCAVRLVNVSWVNEAPNENRNLTAQARYREVPFAVRIKSDVKDITVQFQSPRLAAPGQSLVIYDDERVMGGGIIAPPVHNT